jgi:O-antigen/teichoic acid export membrane protein
MPLARVRSLLADHGVRSLGRRGGVLLSGQVVAAALAVATTIVLARTLGASDYGRYAVITATVTIVYQVIDVRIWEATTRFAGDYLARGERLRARAVLELSLPVNVAGGLLATGLLALFATAIAEHLVKDPDLAAGVVIYACVAPFVALQLASTAVFRIFDRLARLAVLTAVVPALRLIGVAVAVASGGELEAILVASLAAEAAGGIVYVLFAGREIASILPAGPGPFGRLARIRDELPRMGRFLAVSNVTGSLRLLNQQLDVVLAGVLATPAVAGALKVARTFMEPLTLLGRPFFQALYPELVREFAQSRYREFEALMRPATAAMLLFLAPVAIGIAATAPFLVPALVGEGFGQAPLTILPLIAGTLISAVLFWPHPAALALGMQIYSLRVQLIATAVQIALLLALVPTLEAPGAGLAYLAYAVIWALLLVPPVVRRISDSAAAQVRGGEPAVAGSQGPGPPLVSAPPD